MRGLRDKVVLVTGGGHGREQAGSSLGQAMCVELAKEGAKIIVADLTQDRAEATAEEVRAEGGEALALPVEHAPNEQLHFMRAVRRFRSDQIGQTVCTVADLFDQADAQRLFSANELSAVKHTLRLPRTDQIDQQLGIVQRINNSEIGGRDAETRFGCCDANVASHCDAASAPDATRRLTQSWSMTSGSRQVVNRLVL